MGYHEDRAKQFKTHLKMDEETYRKTVETKTVVNLQGKSSSQRFHQRRRRI